jgi:hypothetical protein
MALTWYQGSGVFGLLNRAIRAYGCKELRETNNGSVASFSPLLCDM